MTAFNTLGMGNYGATWESKGYCGAGNVGSLVDSLRGRSAVVCGNAQGVFDEYEAAVKILGRDAVVFGVNDVGMYLDRLDHWVSLHTANLAGWQTVRWLHNKGVENVEIHAPDEKPSVDYIWHGLTPIMAISGYFAMQIAYIMGCAPIVLCGCPGAGVKRFFESAPRSDFSYGAGANGMDAGVREQLMNEMIRLPDFKSKVRSMSGWTRDYFGAFDRSCVEERKVG